MYYMENAHMIHLCQSYIRKLRILHYVSILRMLLIYLKIQNSFVHSTVVIFWSSQMYSQKIGYKHYAIILGRIYVHWLIK